MLFKVKRKGREAQFNSLLPGLIMINITEAFKRTWNNSALLKLHDTPVNERFWIEQLKAYWNFTVVNRVIHMMNCKVHVLIEVASQKLQGQTSAKPSPTNSHLTNFGCAQIHDFCNCGTPSFLNKLQQKCASKKKCKLWWKKMQSC